MGGFSRWGPWTIWLAINKDGRFPDLDHHLPRPADATARCQLSAADAEFLAQTLPKLPADDQFNNPVTVELNGRYRRSKADDQSKPTEVVLVGSICPGEPISPQYQSPFLARALELGFREFHAYSNTCPMACFDNRRKFGVALLAPDTADRPADRCDPHYFVLGPDPTP